MYRKFVYWTPRILSLVFVGFLSIFAFDVFGNYRGLSLVIAFFMHLLPSIVLLLFILAAWKYELVGAVSFVTFGLLYALQVPDHFSWITVISAPSVVVGILYFLDWHLRRSEKKLVRNKSSK